MWTSWMLLRGITCSNLWSFTYPTVGNSMNIKIQILQGSVGGFFLSAESTMTHTCWLSSRRHTHTHTFGCCSGKRKGLHCALWDMTLLDSVASGACVYSKFPQYGWWDEAAGDVNHSCSPEGAIGEGAAIKLNRNTGDIKSLCVCFCFFLFYTQRC